MGLNPNLLKMVSQAKNKYSNSSGNFLKPKDGRNQYRLVVPTSDIAPWIGESGQFWRDCAVHWIKAEENGKPMAVVGDCDVVYQQPSVINTAIDMAINSAIDEDSKKLFESWKSRTTVIIPVIDRADANNTDPQPLELTKTTFGAVLDLYLLHADAGADIADPDHGVDIIITRSGKGLNTEYTVQLAPQVPGKPHTPVTRAQLEKTPDLDKLIASKFFRGEEQKALSAIASIAGITVPRLAAPAAAAGALAAPAAAAPRTPTAALTSASASVPDAKVDDAPFTPDPAPAAAAPAAVAPDAADIEARKAAILARQKAAEAELAALETPAAAPAETPAAAAPALAQSEADAILAELEGLTT